VVALTLDEKTTLVEGATNAVSVVLAAEVACDLPCDI
jgi:hypothetical protein